MSEKDGSPEKKKKKERLWECRRCGYNNPKKTKECAKCGLDKATATTMKIKRRKYCDECGHLHMLDHYCHVYVMAEDAFPEDEEGDALASILNGASIANSTLLGDEEDDGGMNTGGDENEEDDDDGGDQEEDVDDDALFGAAPRRGNRLDEADAEAAAETKNGAEQVDAKDTTGKDSLGDDDFLYNTDQDGEPLELEEEVMRRLETPKEISDAGFLRCNCRAGVPERSRRFIAFPARYEVGEILIKTYDKIREKEREDRRLMLESLRLERSSGGPSPAKSIKSEFSGSLTLSKSSADSISKSDIGSLLESEVEVQSDGSLRKRRWFFKPPPYSTDYNQKVSLILSLVLQFIPLNKIGPMTAASRHFHAGAKMYQDYIDMRDLFPIQVLKIHQGVVTSTLFHHSKVFSGGDKTLMSSSAEDGSSNGTVTRDAGDITHIMEHDNVLYECSSTGNIRSFFITFTGGQMASHKTFIGHHKGINYLMKSLPPPEGRRCHIHKMKDHVCFMFSASDDRTIHVWDLYESSLHCVIKPPAVKEGTFRCLAQSERHLFAGTSAASVMVFSMHNACEREDVHMCNMPKADKTYCLQKTLVLAVKLKTASGNPPLVNQVAAVTREDVAVPYTLLWAGDSVGSISVWRVNRDVGIDFIPTKYWQAHTGAITGMVSAEEHMITIGDDGVVLISHMWRFDRIKRFNMNDKCIERNLYLDRKNISRKLKCMHMFPPQQIIADETSTVTPLGGGGSVGGDSTVGSSVGGGSIGIGAKHVDKKKESRKIHGMISVGTTCGEVILMKLGDCV